MYFGVLYVRCVLISVSWWLCLLLVDLVCILYFGLINVLFCFFVVVVGVLCEWYVVYCC